MYSVQCGESFRIRETHESLLRTDVNKEIRALDKETRRLSDILCSLYDRSDWGGTIYIIQ